MWRDDLDRSLTVPNSAASLSGALFSISARIFTLARRHQLASGEYGGGFPSRGPWCRCLELASIRIRSRASSIVWRRASYRESRAAPLGSP